MFSTSVRLRGWSANVHGGSLCQLTWKMQLKKMMRNSKAKSALDFWAKAGLERGVIVFLHTKLGIGKTLAFLRKTRIATRRWHLERRTEEEVEEVKEKRRRVSRAKLCSFSPFPFSHSWARPSMSPGTYWLGPLCNILKRLDLLGLNRPASSTSN